MSKKHKRAKARDVLLTPAVSGRLEFSDPSGSPLRFRKKILPLGAIDYPTDDGGTRRVVFDRAYHRALIDSFHAGAYEHPPLQLADANNRHNMDPRLTYGHMVGLSEEQPGDTDGPGLYADVEALTPEHAKILKQNPKIGVSAQIVEKLRTVHGKKFPAAVRHILATLDPRVRQLGPWHAVSLSTSEGDDGPVIDLTDCRYEEIEAMGKKREQREAAERAAVLSLSDDEIEAALEAAAQAADEDDDEPDVQPRTFATGGHVSLSDDRGADFLPQFSQALSSRDEALRGVQAQLARSDWEKERLELSNAGVPKPFLDAADEILGSFGESTISLADEDGAFEADPRKVIRTMLELAKGTIDLSDVPGSSEEPRNTDEQATVTAALAAWDNTTGPID